MASTRHIYIYEDVEENLKKEAIISKLINELLRNYYKATDLTKLSIEEIQKRKAILLTEIDCAKKVEAIENAASN